MKRFLIFILFLGFLILAEIYFLTEIFSKKRVLIMLPSLLIALISIIAIFRYFKKYILPSKQSEAQS
jgi:hypothetical protein